VCLAAAVPAAACLLDGQVAVSLNLSQAICQAGPQHVPNAACCSTTASPVWNPVTNKCDTTCDTIDRCVGVTCTAQDQCHEVGTCDPQYGVCSNPMKSDNTFCDDGDACTVGDECLAGTCTPGSPVACRASDACHLAGVCDPQSGCSNPPAPAGTPCGNVAPLGDCDAGDTCDDVGQCHANLLDPSHPCREPAGDCDEREYCDGVDAVCPADTFKPAGTPCGDSTANACTEPDQCDDAGVCQPRDLPCASTTSTSLAASSTTMITATSIAPTTTLPPQQPCADLVGIARSRCLIDAALAGPLCDDEIIPDKTDRALRARLNVVAARLDDATGSDGRKRVRLLKRAAGALKAVRRKALAASKSRKLSKRISAACNGEIDGLVQAIAADVQ
jgi:hypothetical protein